MVAEALRELLPDAIQDLKAWMSESDMMAGDRWAYRLDRQLERSAFGILCLTPENIGAPWLLFEAGSLAKSGSNAQLACYRLGLRVADVPLPLAQFHGVDADKFGTKKLLESVNAALSQPMDPVCLERVFQRWWPNFSRRIEAIPVSVERPRFSQDRLDELIVATQPLSALFLQLRFASSDSRLRKRMRDGEDRVMENAMSSQGGTPAVPFDVVDYKEKLLPLLRYVARIGPEVYDDRIELENEKVDEHSIVVLMPLDESHNAILSFAHISSEVRWHWSSNSTDSHAARYAGQPGSRGRFLAGRSRCAWRKGH